jgi:uncharacterized membrane protein YjjP (DUF1212 family)
VPNNNSIDLSQKLSDVENELTKMNQQLDVVENQYSDITKKIIMLERDKKDLELQKVDISRVIKTAKHNLKNKTLEYEGFKRDYFGAKREGR